MAEQVSAKGTALVTGASQGIGRAIAIRLARDGFDVAVNDLPVKSEALKSLVEEIKNHGRRSAGFLADISVEKEVKAMIDMTIKTFGSLNVMVANAGIAILKPITDISLEEWNRVFSVNVAGTFLCYKYAAVQMIRQGKGGRIIGASSTTGKQGQGFASIYSSSKFAIRGLTHSAAAEFGRHNITVNAYAPGLIDTEMSTAGMASLQKILGDSLPPMSTGVLPNSVGKPEDIANLVSFLASKDASFITGQTVSANAGWILD